MTAYPRTVLTVGLVCAVGCTLNVNQNVDWYAYTTEADMPKPANTDAGLTSDVGGDQDAELPGGLRSVSPIVRSPSGAHDPLSDPEVAFAELTVEGPGLKEGEHQLVTPYLPNAKLKVDDVPDGLSRQLRVGLWPKGDSGEPIGPMLAQGRTIPFDLGEASAAQASGLFAYVTFVNQFAPAIGESNTAAAIDPRVGLSAESMPDWSTWLLGGGVPKPGASDPWDPVGFASFPSQVLKYDTNLRAMSAMAASLNVGRAFHASALGLNGLVAVAGGYTLEDGAPKASKHIEFYDPDKKKFVTSPSASPHLLYPRARHTMTRMFDNDDYFLIVGGKGPDPKAALSWEIWHPKTGVQAQGQLKHARWNHAAVRLPEADGGFIMLIGGEGLVDGKPAALNNFEVIRYDTCGNVARVGNLVVTCKVGGTNYCRPAGDASGLGSDKCAALAAQAGYQAVSWEPIVQPLVEGVGRNLPGAVYVPHGAYHYIYIVGGYSDAARTKPLDRIDIFDIQQGVWVPNQLSLEAARGAPLVAASMVGPRAGQVLISGGIGEDGKTVPPAEVVYVANPGQPTAALQKWPVKTALPDGKAAGVAVPLPSGHVLVTGGVSIGVDGMKPQTTVLLWNPL